MKKKGWLISLALLLCLTGCGTKDPYETAKVNMESLKNYEMAFHIDMQLAGEADGMGMTLDVPVTMDMKVDNETKVSQLDLSVSVFEMTVKTVSYIDTKDTENVITYSKDEDGVWIKSVNEKAALTNVETFIQDVEKPEKVKEEKNLVTYQATIKQEDLKTLLKDVEFDENTEFEIEKDATIEITVDKKQGYITKLAFDLTDCITLKSEDAELTKMNFTVDFSNFDALDPVTIDQEIIDTALEEEVAKIMDYAEDYILEIEWEVMLEDATSYTGTDLEYDGPKPEEVNVQIKDDEVVSGYLVIDGYQVEIADGKVQTPVKK